MQARKELGDSTLVPDLSPPFEVTTSQHVDQLPTATAPQVPESDQHHHVQDDATDIEPRIPEAAKASASTTPHLSPNSHRDPEITTVPPLMQEITPDRLEPILEALAAVIQASTRVQPVRQSTLLVRNELDNKRSAAGPKREYFQESRKAFVDAASKILLDRTEDGEAKGQSQSLNELRKHHELLLQDELYLDAHDETMGRLGADFSQKEFQLQQLEDALQDATRRATKLICDMGLTMPEITDLETTPGLVVREPSVASLRESIAVPPLLATYRDKAGDVNVMYERFNDLEVEQRDSRILRTLRQDQGDPVYPSDEEFDETCREELDQARKAYEHAVEVASFARQACKDAGIDPDERSYEMPIQDEEGPITPDQNTDIREIGYPRILSSAMLTAFTGNLDDEFLGPSPHDDDPEVEQLNSTSRVEEWMERMEGGYTHEQSESEPLPVPETQVAEDTTAETSMAGNVSTVPSLQVDQAYSTDQDSAVTPGSHGDMHLDVLETIQSSEPLAPSSTPETTEKNRKDSPLAHSHPP